MSHLPLVRKTVGSPRLMTKDSFSSGSSRPVDTGEVPSIIAHALFATLACRDFTDNYFSKKIESGAVRQRVLIRSGFLSGRRQQQCTQGMAHWKTNQYVCCATTGKVNSVVPSMSTWPVSASSTLLRPGGSVNVYEPVLSACNEANSPLRHK